jgi:radical SAM superfamily enzyme YgiQ (UPF0313 family)
MISAKPRLVLYFPRIADPASGRVSSKHILPLSLLTIAGWPLADGCDVVIVDGNLYAPEEAHRRVLEACEGALLYGSTGILGYQVADGYLCAEKVRARHPSVFRIAGGWFASALPEPYVESGLFDAVAIGQGELTFREVVHAVAAGGDLASVAGLALWRDGALVRTPHRDAVGWDRLTPCPWQLIDFEPYRAAQLEASQRRAVEALPPPPGVARDEPFVAISYYSSFGCPLPCTFCCSPEFSGRRWKAMPGQRVADDLAELHERWGFDVVNFFDANFAVSEKRTREIADGLIGHRFRAHYYPYVQAASILAFGSGTLDAMKASGLYLACIGAESGDDATMERVGKPTRGDENLRAALELDERGIIARVSYIIGFPGEDSASMLATIAQCMRIARACPRAAPMVWPFHPIPGSALYAEAIADGFRPPSTLLEWGRFADYRLAESWVGRIPPEVARVRKLYIHYAALARGAPRDKVGWWERRAQRRLATEDLRFGALEAKAFDLWQRVEKRVARARPARLERTAT